jgi:hypothetical protein
MPFPGASRGRDAAPQHGILKAGYRGVKLTLFNVGLSVIYVLSLLSERPLGPNASGALTP